MLSLLSFHTILHWLFAGQVASKNCGDCIIRVNEKEVLGSVTMVSPGETIMVELTLGSG